jgi:hypothetical protein
VRLQLMLLRGRELNALYPSVSSPIANRFFHKKAPSRPPNGGSRKMLGEDIGSEQRRSAKSHDFHRELLLCNYARRHRICALAA